MKYTVRILIFLSTTKMKGWGPPFISQQTHTHSKSLLIRRVNNITMWARELLLLTIAKACWVKSHLGCVFLLRSYIEFKQEHHSCGNTSLHLQRTPTEKVLSSLHITTHQLSLCLSLPRSKVWKVCSFYSIYTLQIKQHTESALKCQGIHPSTRILVQY